MSEARHEVVVITGASAGIGRAAVQQFARRGARIALVARDPDRLEAARAEAERLGSPQAIAISADTADYAQVDAAAERAENELGPIDIWVNNAMATVFAPFADIAPEDFRRVTDVTYHGFVWGTMAALKRMRPRNRGTIVQVSSALAYRSIPLQSPYCGAKHAIKGFTQSVRTELEHDHSDVHVAIVDMPGVNTPQFEWCKTTLTHHPKPIGTYYQPEVAGRAIWWAAHARRAEICVGYPTLATMLAEKFVPRLLDRYLARKGVAGQQRADTIPADRPNNLWRPVPGPYGAHGTFDAGASTRSVQLWATTHRGWLLAGVGAAAGVALGLRQLRRH
ncbi:SDR family oxidoreductase [Massilia sp. Root335]|jgi:NAD(P)-dependent dehydrogenase (short-subunit alcohol dehydrogenase family)|uniref:SDR family oxidoreductase n=1 Tax=Massilia sp. Root335 TaxID=1736517 RepID=UPI0006F38E91|nr:SDR family oxidoreductase [Massilia sp. Root335]KQV43229.1 short-chain dehydrogenase [Massilia sp. Root335]